MNDGEGQSISFVVRIWIEDNHPLTWRGHITHVPSGDRLSVQQFSDLNRFINGYIGQSKRPSPTVSD